MFEYGNEIVQEDIKEIISRGRGLEKFKNCSILITGATGMLATYLVYTFMYLNENKAFNIQIYILARNIEKVKNKFSWFIDTDNFHLLLQDVCCNISCESHIDYIIHAAGNASPQAIIHDPVGIIKANTIGSMNILDFARKFSIKKVLYTSTREIYGDVDENIKYVRENDFGVFSPDDVRSSYPESKRMAETLLKSYNYQYGIPYNVVRIAHCYGPGMNIHNDGRVMSDFISDIVNRRNIILKSRGETVRAFCYITDAIVGMLLVLLEGDNAEAYNIANETEPKKIRDVAEILTEMFSERNLQVVYDVSQEDGLGYSKLGQTRLCTDKLEKLGWKCEVSLAEGLRRTVQSFD